MDSDQGRGASMWETFFPDETPEQMSARVRRESRVKLDEAVRRNGVEDDEA